MHELSLMADLMAKVESIARQQRAERVVTVNVQLGALAHISASHLREHFLQAAVGTVAEDARLEVDESTDPEDRHAQDILLESIEVAT